MLCNERTSQLLNAESATPLLITYPKILSQELRVIKTY